MSSHKPHPDSHTHGLSDECPRCEEHAQHPLLTLDSINLRNLIQRVVNREGYRSDTERVAMMNVRESLEQAGRIAQIHPLAFTKYVSQQWDVKLYAMEENPHGSDRS